MRKETISSLKKKADAIFSKFIRLRDADWKGEARCFTCAIKKRWQEMDCGHYEDRGHNSTRYCERNCQIQCKPCNIWRAGRKTIFAVELRKKYGKGILEELRKQAEQTKQFTKDELEEIIERYKRKINDLT